VRRFGAGDEVLRIKICGTTNLRDALAAVEAGADALGFVFAESPRRVTVEAARGIVAGLPPYVTPVGVFVDEAVAEVRRVVAEVGLAAVQLHGAEEPEVVAALAPTPCIKAFRVRSREDLRALGRYRVQGYLLDAFVPGRAGGTGVRFDWRVLEGLSSFPAG
jgi:phosphoribosylanthranilate isomerase